MDYIFLIDAGHGPGTPGKRSPDGSLLEFQFNRPTAEKTARNLLKYQNVQVFYVHYNDSDRSLKSRTDYANQVQAANPGKKVVYISIHANASGNSWSSAKGIETYVYITRPAAAAKLAGNVQRRMVELTRRLDRGVKTADFHVLRETKMDAILVECEFMTNPESLAVLKSDAFREDIAKGIAEGAAATYGLQLKPVPKLIPTIIEKAAEEAAEETAEAPVSPLHAEAWEWAIEAGITAGGNPAGPTTRQQTIQLIYNAILWQQQGGKIL